MPKKCDKIAIKNEKLDRRVKLTQEQKNEIRNSDLSTRKLAAMYDVSRRTIMFVKDPEKLKHNREVRKQNGGWQQYYDKEKHRQYTAKHREYKDELIEKNLI